jgi:hypothetical protein
MIRKKQKIEFWTEHQSIVEVAPVRKAAGMLPKWFEELKPDIPVFDPKFPKVGKILKKYMSKSVKKCPAIVDFLSEGYIIPFWSDVIIQREGDDFQFDKHQGDDRIGNIEFHPYDQIATYPLNPTDFREGVKFINPWFFRTPPGWSTLFIPPIMHNEQRFTVLPGIVETDTFHQVNFPAIWHHEGQTIIERGTPFIQVIPFKRNQFSYDVRMGTEPDMQLIIDQQVALRSKFTGGYRDMTRRNRNGKQL